MEGRTMDTAGKAQSIAATLARLDVETWARKSVRECVAIAGRSSRLGGRAPVDPARVDAVLALLVELLEAERRALGVCGAR